MLSRGELTVVERAALRGLVPAAVRRVDATAPLSATPAELRAVLRREVALQLAKQRALRGTDVPRVIAVVDDELRRRRGPFFRQWSAMYRRRRDVAFSLAAAATRAATIALCSAGAFLGTAPTPPSPTENQNDSAGRPVAPQEHDAAAGDDAAMCAARGTAASLQAAPRRDDGDDAEVGVADTANDGYGDSAGELRAPRHEDATAGDDAAMCAARCGAASLHVGRALPMVNDHDDNSECVAFDVDNRDDQPERVVLPDVMCTTTAHGGAHEPRHDEHRDDAAYEPAPMTLPPNSLLVRFALPRPAGCPPFRLPSGTPVPVLLRNVIDAFNSGAIVPPPDILRRADRRLHLATAVFVGLLKAAGAQEHARASPDHPPPPPPAHLDEAFAKSWATWRRGSTWARRPAPSPTGDLANAVRDYEAWIVDAATHAPPSRVALGHTTGATHLVCGQMNLLRSDDAAGTACSAAPPRRFTPAAGRSRVESLLSAIAPLCARFASTTDDTASSYDGRRSLAAAVADALATVPSFGRYKSGRAARAVMGVFPPVRLSEWVGRHWSELISLSVDEKAHLVGLFDNDHPVSDVAAVLPFPVEHLSMYLCIYEGGLFQPSVIRAPAKKRHAAQTAV